MSTTLTAGDIMSVSVYCWCPGTRQLFVNTRHYWFNVISGNTVTDSNVLAFLDPLLGPAYKAILPSEGAYRGLYGLILNRTVPPASVFVNTSAGPGTDVGNAVPGQVRAVLSLYASGRGHQYRGRQYIGPVTISALDPNGAMTAAFQLKYKTILTAAPISFQVVNGPGQAQAIWCLYNRKTKTPSPIVDFFAEQKFGTQRRSGDYGRTNTPPF